MSSATVFVFLLVIAAAALGLLVNHLVGLRDRVEINASGHSRLRSRLTTLKLERQSASEADAAVIDHEIASVQAQIEIIKASHAKALTQYNKTTASIPTPLVHSVAKLPESALALVA